MFESGAVCANVSTTVPFTCKKLRIYTEGGDIPAGTFTIDDGFSTRARHAIHMLTNDVTLMACGFTVFALLEEGFVLIVHSGDMFRLDNANFLSLSNDVRCQCCAMAFGVVTDVEKAP